MTRIHDIKTNFTSGEVSSDMFGRTDLVAFNNAASCLKNVFISPMGGVRRRDGLKFVTEVPMAGRLVEFSYTTEQCYLMFFYDKKVNIYKEAELVATLDTPWGTEHLPAIRWTQNSNSLFVVHYGFPPKIITRDKENNWNIKEWEFETVDKSVKQPYYKFSENNATMAPSGASGTITLTASESLFETNHVGVCFSINEGEVEITSVSSDTVATAVVKVGLAYINASKDFAEAAFSDVRGYPSTVTFHQDRLVIGGSKSLPNRIWFSKIGSLMNFDLGTGLDDESIEFNILSDQANTICGMFSGRHLQVFTTGAEWMVEGKPLTPANIQLSRQTKVGSSLEIYRQPCYIDGSTVFISSTGKELKEFIFADVDQSYQAHDLSTLSRHLMNDPRDQDYNTSNRLLYIVMGDGTMATVTNYRAENVTAWSWHEIEGKFISVAVVASDTFVLVERRGRYFIEMFDSNCHTDCAIKAGISDDEEKKSIWQGLEHIDGNKVKVLSECGVEGEFIVSGGRIELSYPVSEVEIGLGFMHKISGLPPIINLGGTNVIPGSYRLIKVTFRVINTRQLNVDTGRGAVPAMPKRMSEKAFDNRTMSFSGDVIVRSFGWMHNPIEPAWIIEGDDPVSLHIVSVLTEVKVKE